METLSPGMLEGPRSFFTDLDPHDSYLNVESSLRNLKLQLLTKKWIVIGASSVFHPKWAEILQNDPGLVVALNDGIIIPAIRYDFRNIEGFFQSKKEYEASNLDFYNNNIAKVMVWDLDFNSSWFRDKIFEALDRPTSVLRVKNSIDDRVARDIKESLIDKYLSEDEGNDFLQRKHLESLAFEFNEVVASKLVEYGNLIYRMSGARTVDSEGHFPQSNITEINISGNDEQLSDESIFWDIYAEAVFSNINKSVRISKDRLDQLEFADILEIRKALFATGFCESYDVLLKSVKESVDLDDPEKLVLHAEEIASIAIRLRSDFSSELKEDVAWFNSRERANSMWQLANGLSILGGPITGTVMGIVSTLGSLPEITAPMSKPLSTQLHNRFKWMERFVNGRLGWSKSNRGAFLQAYKELVTYGLP